MTPTGSIRHLGSIEHAYFSRPLPPPPLPDGWEEELWHNGDMWVRSTESSAAILTWYDEACEQADQTIQMLDLDAPGEVPHWDEGHRATTLGDMIVLVLGEECRHGGHIDVVRELVDGRAGSDYGDFGEPGEWQVYVARVQAAADFHATGS